MTKVLFISGYLARNGTEAFMMNVFRNIDKTRFRVDFLCFSREDMAYEEEIKKCGSHVFVLPGRRNGLTYFNTLNDFFRTHRYDVAHWCTCSCSTIAPLYYAWKHRVPLRITHSHNSSCSGLRTRILHYLLRPVLNQLTNKRLACSNKAGEWLFGKRGCTIIKNGIDLAGFSYDRHVREQMRIALGISSRTTAIGHVGRFDPVKNHAFLVDVFARYVERNADAKLMLIGIGPTRGAVEEKVRQLHLEGMVLFLGERTDVNKLLQAMDVFVMPSVFEGLPYVLVEAQASGLPCLVSDTVDHHVKIIPQLDFLPLTHGAARWADNVESLLKTFQRTKTDQFIIGNGFSIENTVRLLESIYSR